MANSINDVSLRSTQAAQYLATGNNPLHPRDVAGRVRCMYFDYTVPTGGITAADYDDFAANTPVIQLTAQPFPKGSRFLFGMICVESGFVASAALDIGLVSADGSTTYTGSTTNDLDILASNVNPSSADTLIWLPQIAAGGAHTVGTMHEAFETALDGLVFTKDTHLVAASTANLVADKRLFGWAQYVLD